MTQLRIPALLLSAALVLAAPARADDHKASHEAAREALAKGRILPLARILAIAAAKAPGDVLKVELEDHKGRMIYELKILARSGRVLEMELDAASGAVLKLEDD